eukprot:SAG31_NODE_1091_length_9958_cov_10.108429_7_plen_92_part_00
MTAVPTAVGNRVPGYRLLVRTYPAGRAPGTPYRPYMYINILNMYPRGVRPIRARSMDTAAAAYDPYTFYFLFKILKTLHIWSARYHCHLTG